MIKLKNILTAWDESYIPMSFKTLGARYSQTINPITRVFHGSARGSERLLTAIAVITFSYRFYMKIKDNTKSRMRINNMLSNFKFSLKKGEKMEILVKNLHFNTEHTQTQCRFLNMINLKHKEFTS